MIFAEDRPWKPMPRPGSKPRLCLAYPPFHFLSVSRLPATLDVQKRRRRRSNYEFSSMDNPSESDFMQDDPLAAMQPTDDYNSENAARTRRGLPAASTSASEKWQQTKEKASAARERTEFFLRENPVPTIIGALALGLAVGWALRYATAEDEKEVEIESPLGRVNWSFLSLPFLWPFLKSVREKYEDSAETVKDGVDRLREIDVKRYTKPIRKRWKTWTD